MLQLFRNESEEPGEEFIHQAKGSGDFLPSIGINEAVSGVLCLVLTSPEQTGVQKGTTERLEGWICYVFIEAKGKSN